MKSRKYIESLTTSQLIRLHFRIWNRIEYGGHFGWDAPTLRIVHPHFYQVLRMISEIYHEKMQSNNEIAFSLPWNP